MSLGSPWALAWGLLVVPLVALYLLERRRRATHRVPSLLLYRRVERALAAARPTRRLRPLVSLLLQVLAIVAGAAALAEPSGCGAGPALPAGGWAAVVIDTSLSMTAPVEPGARRSRLDAALADARSLVDALPEGARGVVVTAGPTPSVRAGPTPDRRALRRALAGIRPEGPGADLEGAVAAAAARLAGAPPGSRVVVLGDAPVAALPAVAGLEVAWRPIGAPLDNDAIAGVSVAPDPDEPDAAEILVRLERRAAAPAARWVTVARADGSVLASRRVSLPAEGGAAVALRTPPLTRDPDGGPPHLEVRVAAPAGAPPAAFSLDDVAHVAAPGEGALPVVLVGPVPPPVERAVVGAPRVDPFRVAPADLAALLDDPASAPRDPLWVVAGDVPSALPPGDALVVAPSGDAPLGVALGVPARPAVRVLDWARADPRLRWTGLGGQVWRGARVVADARAVPLVTTDAGPVVVDVPRGGGATTLVAFDPARAGWARDPSFVVFVRNVVEAARARRDRGGVADGALGEALRVPAPDGAEVTVETPGGATRRAVARAGLALVPVPPEPGAYAVRIGDGPPRRVLRDLSDGAEVDLRPAPRVGAPAAGADAPRDPAVVAAGAASGGGPPRWPWAVALLLVALVADLAWGARGRRVRGDAARARGGAR